MRSRLLQCRSANSMDACCLAEFDAAFALWPCTVREQLRPKLDADSRLPYAEPGDLLNPKDDIFGGENLRSQQKFHNGWSAFACELSPKGRYRKPVQRSSWVSACASWTAD